MDQLPRESTLYSLDGDPPAECNRRSGERHLTLFRVASIMVGDRRELCLVKNVSAGGALIRAYCALEPGTDIRIELNEGQPLGGKVGWLRGNDCGISFDKPIDVLGLLKTAGDGPRPRMPRVEIACVGFVREGAIVRRSAVGNISQGGVCVECDHALTLGADVTVSLPGLPPQGAVVRWKDGNRYGISFNSVLPLAVLVEWLHQRQGG